MPGMDRIAEEFSEQANGLNHAQDSTARIADGEIGIPHLYCGPDRDGRRKIRVNNEFDREKEWFGRLKNSENSSALFICGEHHIESFKALHIQANYNAEGVGAHRGIGWESIG